MIGVAAAILIVIAFHDLDVSAQPPSKSKSSASPVPAKTDVVDPKVAMVAGRVVNPEGKPVSGAKIFVRFPAEKDAGEPLGESNADGRFKVPLSLMSVSDRATVIAHAAGFAATWQTWTGHPPEDLNLKLVKDDVPVSGRILDLEGKPIRGAIIRVNAVQTFPNDGPEAFVQWLAGRRSRPLQNTVFGVPPGTQPEPRRTATGNSSCTASAAIAWLMCTSRGRRSLRSRSTC